MVQKSPTHKWNKSLCNYWGAGGPNEKFWPQCGAEDAIQGFVHAKQTLYQMKGIPRPLQALSEFLLPLPPKERLQLCTYPGLSKSGVHMARGIWRLTGYIFPCAFHRRILSILKMSYSLGKRRDNSPLLLLKGKFLKLSNSHQWETFTLLRMCLTTFTRVHPSNQTLAATHKDASMLPKNPSTALVPTSRYHWSAFCSLRFNVFRMSQEWKFYDVVFGAWLLSLRIINALRVICISARHAVWFFFIAE